jgi:hypothetical protein
MSEILDVQYGKLSDWLIDRKKMPAQWQERVRSARTTIEKNLSAISEMDAKVKVIVDGNSKDLNYYHCTRIMELLEATQEGNAKNMFGQVGRVVVVVHSFRS